nr:HlyD family efflux transporter periplasmic adaptor subunit [Sphingobium scionense]
MLLAILALSIAFHVRSETATGKIVPAGGLISLRADAMGSVAKIFVKQGQTVNSGDIIAEVRVERSISQYDTSETLVLKSLSDQDSDLDSQVEESRKAEKAQINRAKARMEALAREITSLDRRASLYTDLVKRSEDDLQRIADVVDRGFISVRDVNDRRDTLATKQIALDEIIDQRDQKRSELFQEKQELDLLLATSKSNQAAISLRRNQISEAISQTMGLRSYLVRAPASGTIAALDLGLGSSIVAGQEIASLYPRNSALEAELNVSPSAIGSIRVGMPVELAIDAFPKSQYGMLVGVISEVAGAPVKASPSDQMSAYKVRVRFYRKKGNEALRLIPGMTLKASIEVERRRMIRWMFSGYERL